ncbi:hypothetical protein V8C35DRAFT_179622 [Trichoderma chlorosporum]
MFFCEPLPWRIPVPFVGAALRTFAALVLLANTNALYDKMEIFGPNASLPIYATNLFLIGAIFLVVCIFAALKQRNYTFDSRTLLTAITLTVLWTATCCYNVGIVVGALIQCNVTRFRTAHELKYCHFFGNKVVAKSHGWEGKSWPVYYWVSMCSALIMSIWQMLNWLSWIRDVREGLLIRLRRQQHELTEWA